MNNMTIAFNTLLEETLRLLPNVADIKDQVSLRIKLLDVMTKSGALENKHLLEIKDSTKKKQKDSKAVDNEVKEDMPVVDTSSTAEAHVAEAPQNNSVVIMDNNVPIKANTAEEMPMQERSAQQTDKVLEPSAVEVEAPIENDWTEEDKQNEAETIKLLEQYKAVFSKNNKMKFLDDVLNIITKGQYTKYTTPYDLPPKTAHLLAVTVHNLIEKQRNKQQAS